MRLRRCGGRTRKRVQRLPCLLSGRGTIVGMFREFDIQGENVAVRCCGCRDAANAAAAIPFVYLHSLGDSANQVAERCADSGCPPFVLVSIEVPSWNDDLTPWECPGVFADDEPFGGKAAEQLRKLEAIVDEVESNLAVRPAQRCIAGYSLAGLFAAWAPFHIDLFDAVASASGSMWYPGFAEYVATHDFCRSPRQAYFSLGSKEARTPSRLLRTVADGTRSVVHSYQAKGVETIFESNPGNHFKEPDMRMAKAIRWALSERSKGDFA